jgi:hypothetical protein
LLVIVKTELVQIVVAETLKFAVGFVDTTIGETLAVVVPQALDA